MFGDADNIGLGQTVMIRSNASIVKFSGYSNKSKSYVSLFIGKQHELCVVPRDVYHTKVNFATRVSGFHNLIRLTMNGWDFLKMKKKTILRCLRLGGRIC